MIKGFILHKTITMMIMDLLLFITHDYHGSQNYYCNIFHLITILAILKILTMIARNVLLYYFRKIFHKMSKMYSDSSGEKPSSSTRQPLKQMASIDLGSLHLEIEVFSYPIDTRSD